MSDGLKSKTLHGLFWSFFEFFGQIGIYFVIQIILARLLLPEQFGLIAMLTIFIAIAQALVKSVHTNWERRLPEICPRD